jgi:lipoprotein signal peptidase
MQSTIEAASGVATPRRASAAVNFDSRSSRRLLVLVIAAGIVVLDQSLKWWAWRNVSGVHINYSGDMLVPAAVSSMYGRPVSGALLDMVDSVLLIGVITLFLRRRRSRLALISGSFIIGGWTSNLLDRLAMHYWTAPGSVRGVVDFILIGQRDYNLADLFIIGATPFFIVAVCAPVVRRIVRRRPVAVAQTPPKERSTRGTRSTVSAVAALTALTALTAAVGLGAANFGGLTAPTTSTNSSYQPVAQAGP